MATDASFAEYVLEQIALPRRVEARRMFGEYALYLDGKVVALLCDNQLFLKPLEELRARLAHVDEAPPYPGAKPHFRIADELERPAELTALLLEAARLLPAKAERQRGARATAKVPTRANATRSARSTTAPKRKLMPKPKPKPKPKPTSKSKPASKPNPSRSRRSPRPSTRRASTP